MASVPLGPGYRQRYPMVWWSVNESSNPYEPVKTDSAPSRVRLWWWPAVLGFTVSPVLIILDMGYGFPMPREQWIFPLFRPLSILFDIDDGLAAGVWTGYQFVSYGVFLSVANYQSKLRRGVLWVVVFHCICCVIATPTKDLFNWFGYY